MKTMHVISVSEEEMDRLKMILNDTAEAVRMSQITVQQEVTPGTFSKREMMLLNLTVNHLERMGELLQALMLMLDSAQTTVLQ